MRRIVCISDTHNFHRSLHVPAGDMLIHCGDATVNGTEEEIGDFADWFRQQPHEHKIFVAGNHDWLFERNPATACSLLGREVIYLQDSMTEVLGLKIYGSPWQPRFFDWAFNLSRGEEMAARWELIPPDIDILITHGPPNGILDSVPRGPLAENAGCEELAARLRNMRKGRLRLHVFGHIHEGYGIKAIDGITFVNASVCDAAYNPKNRPIEITI